MGTREVYEEKLRTGNLYHDPTINPGLGSPRCSRCLSLINPPSTGEAEWTITSVLHDAAAVAGSGAGAMLSAVHGFNTGIPFVQKHVKGPKWMQFVIGVPPLLLFSGASAAFGAYALPKFAQLSVTSYYTAWTTSHYTISQITRFFGLLDRPVFPFFKCHIKQLFFFSDCLSTLVKVSGIRLRR